MSLNKPAWLRLVRAFCFAGLYLLLFIWFKGEPGSFIQSHAPANIVLLTSVAKLLFVAYMGVIFATIGGFALCMISGRLNQLTKLEILLINFFVGSSIFRLAFFILGTMGLYSEVMALAASLPFVFCCGYRFSLVLGWGYSHNHPRLVSERLAEK